MLNVNRLMITGRMTRNPETRNLPTGTLVVSFSIAVNRRYQANGEWKEETFFIEVEAWGKLAERCADTQRFYKGRPVFVEGRLKLDEWERDGVKRTSTRIHAENITPFDVPKAGERATAPEATDSYNSAPAPAYNNAAAAAPATNPYAPSPAAAPLPAPGASPRPSDGLNWGGAPAAPTPATDDMPF